MSGEALPLTPSCGSHPSSKHISKEISSTQNKPPKQRTNSKQENEGADRPTTGLSGRRCVTVAVDEQFLFLNHGGKIHFYEPRERKPNTKQLEETCNKFWVHMSSWFKKTKLIKKKKAVHENTNTAPMKKTGCTIHYPKKINRRAVSMSKISTASLH